MDIKQEKSKYTRKIYTPIYEPKNKKPNTDELYNTEKRDELLKEINLMKDLPNELKKFLISSAERHTIFHFEKIADYYSHLPYKYKRFFEASGLVIIDYDSAIRNGFLAYEKEVDIDRMDYLENQITLENLNKNKNEIDKKRTKKFKEELEFIKSDTNNDIIIEEEW